MQVLPDSIKREIDKAFEPFAPFIGNVLAKVLGGNQFRENRKIWAKKYLWRIILVSMCAILVAICSAINPLSMMFNRGFVNELHHQLEVSNEIIGVNSVLIIKESSGATISSLKTLDVLANGEKQPVNSKVENGVLYVCPLRHWPVTQLSVRIVAIVNGAEVTMNRSLNIKYVLNFANFELGGHSDPKIAFDISQRNSISGGVDYDTGSGAFVLEPKKKTSTTPSSLRLSTLFLDGKYMVGVRWTYESYMKDGVFQLALKNNFTLQFADGKSSFITLKYRDQYVSETGQLRRDRVILKTNADFAKLNEPCTVWVSVGKDEMVVFLDQDLDTPIVKWILPKAQDKPKDYMYVRSYGSKVIVYGLEFRSL